MKNIHVLSTTEATNLIYHNGRYELLLPPEDKETWNNNVGKYIYITSDEEIKVGDFYINTFVSEREQKPQTHIEKRYLLNHKKDYRFKYCKKIILTTDQDLIKEDVQPINDEFLEWFVKNPTCEFVNFISYTNEKALKEYEIILPKEELKQHYLSESLPILKDLSRLKTDNHYNLVKQETLEEAVEKYAEENKFGSDRPFEFNRDKHAFKQGAKWQEQNSDKKYSKDKMLEVLHKFGFDYTYNYKGEKTIYEWIPEWFEEYKRLEQYKNK